jgi:polyisoprenoid-binding protein YceI
MKLFPLRQLLPAALMLLPLPAALAAEKYALDRVHTQIVFNVDHLGFSKSSGRFTDFDGGFVLDADPAKSSAEISIRSASVDMGDYAWDKHLRDKDFFHSSQHPAMSFKSTRVEKTGDKTLAVTGDFTLLGVTKPVTLNVTVNKAGVHPVSKKYVAGFSATTRIKRSDFGMSYLVGLIGDEVDIRLEIEGIRDTPPSAAELPPPVASPVPAAAPAAAAPAAAPAATPAPAAAPAPAGAK